MPVTARTYARITDGVVAELLTSAISPTKLFHPALVWVDVTDTGVAVGWLHADGQFRPPAPPVAAKAATIAELQAQLAAVAAKLAALSAA